MPPAARQAGGEWFHGFFAGLYGRVLAQTFDEARTLQQASIVRRLLRLRKGQRVLDVPCGQGRLTLPLARRGMAMTGVDLMPHYLRQARRAAARAGLGIRFLRRDMRRIEFDGEFDAAFNWFTSIGYFSDEEDLDFCRRVLRSLRPGGRFLVETIHKTWLLPRFVKEAGQKVGDVQIFHRNRYDPATSRTTDVWTFRHDRRIERHAIRLRLYSGPELRKLLANAGFTNVRLYGNPPLGPLTRKSPRLIAVCCRPLT